MNIQTKTQTSEGNAPRVLSDKPQSPKQNNTKHERKTQMNTYPDCYLHVTECRSGETWIQPIAPNAHLDIKRQVKKWIANQFDGELRLDGDLMPRLQGDYYATIITDNRPPDSIVVWTSGGFFLK